MNIAYCIKLKQKAIVDVFIIAVGFVFRVLVGGFATGIWVSHWIILMTFLLALFLAFAKRRDDIVMFEETGVKARQNVDRYNVVFMNQAIGIVASITIVCYIMYTVPLYNLNICFGRYYSLSPSYHRRCEEWKSNKGFIKRSFHSTMYCRLGYYI